MEKRATKKKVFNERGQAIRMNDIALRMAERHFKVSERAYIRKDTPTELLDLPQKVEIVKAKKKEQEVKEEVKPGAEIKSEVRTEELKSEIIDKLKPAQKKVTRKRNEAVRNKVEKKGDSADSN
jgi:hypothetical protein